MYFNYQNFDPEMANFLLLKENACEMQTCRFYNVVQHRMTHIYFDGIFNFQLYHKSYWTHDNTKVILVIKSYFRSRIIEISYQTMRNELEKQHYHFKEMNFEMKIKLAPSLNVSVN